MCPFFIYIFVYDFHSWRYSHAKKTLSQNPQCQWHPEVKTVCFTSFFKGIFAKVLLLFIFKLFGFKFMGLDIIMPWFKVLKIFFGDFSLKKKIIPTPRCHWHHRVWPSGVTDRQLFYRCFSRYFSCGEIFYRVTAAAQYRISYYWWYTNLRRWVSVGERGHRDIGVHRLSILLK